VSRPLLQGPRIGSSNGRDTKLQTASSPLSYPLTVIPLPIPFGFLQYRLIPGRILAEIGSQEISRLLRAEKTVHPSARSPFCLDSNIRSYVPALFRNARLSIRLAASITCQVYRSLFCLSVTASACCLPGCSRISWVRQHLVLIHVFIVTQMRHHVTSRPI
jgi:hypothetical protein